MHPGKHHSNLCLSVFWPSYRFFLCCWRPRSLSGNWETWTFCHKVKTKATGRLYSLSSRPWPQSPCSLSLRQSSKTCVFDLRKRPKRAPTSQCFRRERSRCQDIRWVIWFVDPSLTWRTLRRPMRWCHKTQDSGWEGRIRCLSGRGPCSTLSWRPPGELRIR